MASVTIMTGICRASHAHFAKPYQHQPGDEPKYQVKAMFPKSGTGVVSKLGVQFPSSRDALLQAIAHVTQQEWGWAYTDAAQAKQFGINMPPEFQDGDLKMQRDDKGNPLPGTKDPISAGYWMVSLKNKSPIGCVGPDAKDIDPATIYSGCWINAQVEVSAYTNNNGSRIISIQLLNVMMCYNDEAFGRGPVEAASSAFAAHTVANSDIKPGTGQVMSMPAATPIAPVAPVAPVALSAKVYVHTCPQFTKEQYVGWTEEQLVANGKGRFDTPVVSAPPVAPAAPIAPVAPVAPAAPVAPVAPLVPTTGKVIMNADSPHTYEALKANNWTDDQIIAAGYAVPNYTNPA